MYNQEYLDQISAKPAKSKSSFGLGKIFSSKIAIFMIIALIAFIGMWILGAVLGQNKGSGRADTIRLYLHLNSTETIINEYQPSVKSSELRSRSASLASIIANTSSKLGAYLTEKYDFKEKDVSKDTLEQINTEKDAIISELFEAKINGYLDRVYTHKLTYEIERLMNEETKVYNGTNDDSLKEMLDESYASLENIYNSLNGFPES